MKKKIENNDKKNFFWNIIGLSTYSFSSLFLFLACKYINGINVSGIFSYAFSLCSILYIVSMFYNRSFQISKINGKYSFKEFMTARIITSIITLIICVTFCFFSGFSLNKILIILLLIFYRIFDAIGDIYYGFIQYNEKLWIVGISLFLKSTISLILFIVVDLFTKNIYLSSLMLPLVYLLFLLILDRKIYINIYKNSVTDKKKKNNIKKILNESFPIFIFSFLSIYLYNCQKYIITYYASDKIQSIFGILIMPATVLSLVSAYLINPFVTKINKCYSNRQKDELKKTVYKIFFFVCLISIIIVFITFFIGIDTLGIIYGTKLNTYKLDFIIIIVGSIFAAFASIMSIILTLINCNKKQLLSFILSSIISTLICLLMIKNNCIRAASISYLISNIVNFFLLTSIYYYELRKWGESK